MKKLKLELVEQKEDFSYFCIKEQTHFGKDFGESEDDIFWSEKAGIELISDPIVPPHLAAEGSFYVLSSKNCPTNYNVFPVAEESIKKIKEAVKDYNDSFLDKKVENIPKDNKDEKLYEIKYHKTNFAVAVKFKWEEGQSDPYGWRHLHNLLGTRDPEGRVCVGFLYESEKFGKKDFIQKDPLLYLGKSELGSPYFCNQYSECYDVVFPTKALFRKVDLNEE